MRSALNEPFGTPLYIPEREREYDGPTSSGQTVNGTASSYVGPSVPRPPDDVDASLLRASGYAVSRGQSPLSFAKDHV